nr:methionine-R-sulfoxide reductase B3 isoform X2 [Saimiri boliviensis boliviensis]XP_039327783.1 methionine-R-sulfoxide reductase B3 isoform X2 [Saimiri boliviensis boliviensis]
MSAFNLLHLVTKSQPVALRACGLPSGSCRDKKNCKVVFSQQELRKRLTPLQYHVTQEKGTESAFEGEYTHHKDPGIYKCVVCGTPLFKSETKFDSGSGWPSFHDVISSEAITFTDDFSYGMHRVETSCSQLIRLLRHLVFVRWLCCIILMIAGEHLLAFERLKERLWGTKWPHPVYIFIAALLIYLLTSGKNLQVNLLGSFSKE